MGKTDDKKPGMTDEQKRQANCKQMEGMAAKMTATGVDLSADPSKIGKEKVDALCEVFKHFPKEKADQFAKCSTKNQLLVAGARKICAAGGKKPDDKKPVRKPVVKKCEKSTAVNEANCRKENIAKVQDTLCRLKLIKDCIRESKQDCKALTSAPSADKCTLEAIKSSLKGKPECLIPLRTACKSFLQKNSKSKPVEIPKDCTSWFDGCNVCTANKGKKTGCSKKICNRDEKAFCKAFESGKKCLKQRATGKSECDDKQGPEKKNPTCEDVTSNLKLSAKEMCLKASTLCQGKPEFDQNCEVQREKDSKDKCKGATDKRKKAYCCVQGFLEGTGCEAYGSSDRLPSDCKTRCVKDGKLKVSDKTCVRCRGKDDLRPDGVNKDDKEKSKPFDPARIKETIKNLASVLNEAGKKCVKRVAQAASTLKTQIQQWRKDPSKKEEGADEVDLKSVADVQSELDEVSDESAGLEDEFADDDNGKNYRKDNEADTLKEKMSDAADKKPKNCATEFAALRKAYNDIVDEYVGLPQKLKKESVERVKLSFEDIDIGSTNLKDSKNVCSFAKKLVGRLKKAEDNHKKRLAAARKLVCSKAGELGKSKVISKLFTCLRAAKKAADAGSDQTAKDDANKDVTNFDNNGYKRVEKLLKLTAKKCLMKDTPQSKKARVAGLFRKKLKTKIKRKMGNSTFTDDDKKKIAGEISQAVLKKFSQAKNIETTFSSDSSARRQLRPRRVLAAGEVTVSTTYDLDTPAKVSDEVEVQLTDANVVSSESSFEPKAGSSIEESDPVTEIDTELPTGEETTKAPTGEETTKASTGEETTKAPTDATEGPKVEVDTGVKEVVFGTAAAICATILLV